MTKRSHFLFKEFETSNIEKEVGHIIMKVRSLPLFKEINFDWHQSTASRINSNLTRSNTAFLVFGTNKNIPISVDMISFLKMRASSFTNEVNPSSLETRRVSHDT